MKRTIVGLLIAVIAIGACNPTTETATQLPAGTEGEETTEIEEISTQQPELTPANTPKLAAQQTERDDWISFIATGGQQVLPVPGLYVARPDGTRAQMLTESPFGGYYNWSPDGSKIAFYRVSSDLEDASLYTAGLYTINYDGSDLKNVIYTTSGDSLLLIIDVKPAWSPDSEWLALVAVDGLIEGLYKIRADGSDLTLLASNPLRIKEIAWSPTGEWIATVFLTNIYLVSSDETKGEVLNLTKLPYQRPGGGVLVAQDPHWSPDGTQLSFNSNKGRRQDIYVYGINEEGVAVSANRVSNTEVGGLISAWSPVENRIAYASPAGIHIVESKGTNEIFLHVDRDTIGLVRELSWSPDGQKIVFATRSSDPETIHIIDVASGELYSFFEVCYPCRSPQWRP